MRHGGGFEDLVPSWMFVVRTGPARLATALVVAAAFLAPLFVVGQPDAYRFGPFLVVGLVAVAAVAGAGATALAGAVTFAGYWWDGIPPAASFRLDEASAWLGLVSMGVLVVGLVVLTHRVERAVRDVRQLDVRRQLDNLSEVTTRVDAERDAEQLRSVLALSERLAGAGTLREVAESALAGIDLPAVPTTGSIGIVRDGHLTMLAAKGADRPVLDALGRVDLRESPWLRDVLAGRAALVDDRDEFAAAHPDAGVLRLYPAGSWAVVPFRSETTVGLLSVHFLEPQQVTAYASYFSLVAETLASALDRARAEERRLEHLADLRQSFDERDRIARTLSTTLLPPRLPNMPGFTTAAWLQPASADEVAGDFYDLFATPDGWVAVLGDVCGKGAEAAAVTSLARYAARATALDDPDPVRIAEVANAALVTDTSDLFVTMALVRYVAVDAHIEVTLAGHPKVLLLSDGEVHPVGEYGVALGLSADGRHKAVRHPFGPGDCVVLYSDGLIERNQSFGPDELDAALAGVRPTSAREVAELLRVTVAALDVEHADDMAVLVLARDA